MPAPTRRQREVFDIIARHMNSHGYRPSYQLIANRLGLRSRAGVARIVRNLEELGMLSRHRENGHFSIEVNGNEAGIAVPWLNVPHDEGDIGDLPPILLPSLLLGDYDPDFIRAFRVRDDAMDPEVCEDDIILVELRDFCRPGQPVVAVLNGKQTIFRKYNRSGGEIEFHAYDDSAAPIVLAANHVQIVGVYRGLVRPMA